MVRVQFAAGTLRIEAPLDAASALPPDCRWDPREGCHRAPAMAYPDLLRALGAAGVEVDDQARAYTQLGDGPRIHRTPRDYQRDALTAWRNASCRGVVVLPTGAGKTHVAVMAIEDRRRSTLVVAPTLDLVRQWYDILRSTFAVEVGIIGGGSHDLRPLTVTTYDSAYLHMPDLGDRFGMLVFDECHHLPGDAYALAARLSLAPFRLGLTATPERVDERHHELVNLIGPTVFRRSIQDLSGGYLADYETVRVEVELSPSEREEYETERAIYRDFIRANGIRMGGPRGWGEFVMRSAQSEVGRRAHLAYRRQRHLAFAAAAKLDYLEHLLRVHHADRTLVFTQDNATAYQVSRRFLVPVITHQTKVKERSEILAGFSSGELGVIATSKVLNEGVDVPDANVAVVLSGSGAVREHVQRLGRILRPRDGKRATLYELVSADTAETHTSDRRREHEAYRP